MTVEEENSMSGAAQMRRSGRTGRAGAHDHHIPRSTPKFVAGERRGKHQRAVFCYEVSVHAPPQF